MAVARHTWYLRDWLRAEGKLQADLEKDLGMNKAKVSLLANGKQPYDQDDISEIAEYLKIRPYELLMHPEEAKAIRQFRASAGHIAAMESGEEYVELDEFSEVSVPRIRERKQSRRTGTHG